MKNERVDELVNDVVKIGQQQITKYQEVAEIDRAILQMDDELTGFGEKLESKNALFTQLANMSGLVESYRGKIAELLTAKDGSWPGILAVNTLAERENLRMILLSLQQTIRETVTLEGEVIAFLEGRMAEVQKELRVITQYKELSQAYLDRPEKFPEPQVFDKIK